MKKLLNTFINIGIISFILLGLAECFIFIPVQTGIYRVMFYPNDYSFNNIDIMEIVVYYFCLICYLVAFVLFSIAKSHFDSKNEFASALFHGSIFLIFSSGLFLIGNIVFYLMVRIISFELLYVFVGFVGLFVGASLLIYSLFRKASSKKE